MVLMITFLTLKIKPFVSGKHHVPLFSVGFIAFRLGGFCFVCFVFLIRHLEISFPLTEVDCCTDEKIGGRGAM